MGSKFGYKFGIFGKCSKKVFDKDFGKLYMQSGNKFQHTDNLAHSKVINNKYLLKLIICTSVVRCGSELILVCPGISVCVCPGLPALDIVSVTHPPPTEFQP